MFQFIWSRLKIFRGTFIIIAICSILISATDLLVPFLTAKFIDEILTARDVAAFRDFVVLMFGVFASALTAHYACTIFSRRIETVSTYRLISEILRRVQNARGEFVLQTDMVYLSKRIDADARGLMSFAVNSAVELCINFVMLGLAIFLLATIGAKWLALFFCVLILHISLYKILSQTLFNRSIALRENEAKYFTDIADNLVYAYAVKLHGLHEEFAAALKNKFADYLNAVLREIRVKFWFVSTEVNSSDVFRIIVFILGGLDVLSGEMTVGNLVALIGYYALAMQSVSYFMSFGQSFQDAAAAYQRILKIEEIPPEINGAVKFETVNRISAKNIFYEIKGRAIVKNFSGEFRRGKIYCIVGKNGAGKSTLINILCGILRANDGEIFYNGVEIGAVDMAFIRKNCIAVVAQKDFRRNDNLSGGERKKFTIAETFNKNVGVVIMDEPDNNLDDSGIKNLREKIISGKMERLTIIITHDARLVEIADSVIEI